jgi:hypothetical protein
MADETKVTTNGEVSEDDETVRVVSKYIDNNPQPQFEFGAVAEEDDEVDELDDYVENRDIQPLPGDKAVGARLLRLILVDALKRGATSLSFWPMYNDDHNFTVCYEIDGQLLHVMTPPARLYPELLIHLQRFIIPSYCEELLCPPPPRGGFFSRRKNTQTRSAREFDIVYKARVTEFHLDHMEGEFSLRLYQPGRFSHATSHERQEVFTGNTVFSYKITPNEKQPIVSIDIIRANERDGQFALDQNTESAIEKLLNDQPVFAENGKLQFKANRPKPGVILVEGSDRVSRRALLRRMVSHVLVPCGTYYMGIEPPVGMNAVRLSPEQYGEEKNLLEFLIQVNAKVLIIDLLGSREMANLTLKAATFGLTVIAGLPTTIVDRSSKQETKKDQWQNYLRRLFGPDQSYLAEELRSRVRLVIRADHLAKLCPHCRTEINTLNETDRRHFMRSSGFIAGPGCWDCRDHLQGNPNYQGYFEFIRIIHPYCHGTNYDDQIAKFFNEGVISITTDI